MSALTEVREVLEPLALDKGWPILGRLPSNVTTLSLAIVLDQIEHPEGMPMQMRNWTVNVFVLSPLTDPSAADLQLEDAVDDVLDAIDAAQPLRWSTSRRVVIDEDFNAIQVPVEITMQPPPPQPRSQP